MHRTLVALLVFAALVASHPVVADINGTEEALTPRILGDPDAPVTIEEFASLTCPGCASFHTGALPGIKKDFIDTGKVKLVFTDFPLDSLAMAGSMLARCAEEKRFFGFIEVLFRTQSNWSGAKNPRQALMGVARLGGMSQADFEACLGNQALMDGIRKRAKDAQNKHGISSTPSFVVNGDMVEMTSMDDLRQALERAVANP